MTALRARPGPSTFAPTDGSRTMTLRDSQPREEGEGEGSGEGSGEGGSGGRSAGVLHLRGGPRTGPRVAWTDDVVDNEGMGKKKSKICCIYHKPRRFDESSDEDSSESESDADSDAGDVESARPSQRFASGRQRRHHHHAGHDHDHDHDHDECGESNGGTRTRISGGGTVVELEEAPEPNAYERRPKGKGKGKAGQDGASQ